MRSLAALNRGKPYAKQIKPFNFLLAAHVRPFGHPIGVDPERFHLIAPFESNPNKWLIQPWIDVYSTKRYRVTTSQARGPKIASLLTYGDVLREYEYHEESKCAGPDGKPCARPTIGLLSRRHALTLAKLPDGNEHGPGKLPESPGGDSNRAVKWGIPVKCATCRFAFGQLHQCLPSPSARFWQRARCRRSARAERIRSASFREVPRAGSPAAPARVSLRGPDRAISSRR
jgi:hypothetical protein